jgi:hypothetical protein
VLAVHSLSFLLREQRYHKLIGERIKKKLSERVHHDLTGVVMHRDLFSAYLSRHINDDKLSLQDAASQYPGTEPFFQEAWKRYKETAKRVGDAESGQSHSPPERFSRKLRKCSQIADRKKSGRKAPPNSYRTYARPRKKPGFWYTIES